VLSAVADGEKSDCASLALPPSLEARRDKQPPRGAARANATAILRLMLLAAAWWVCLARATNGNRRVALPGGILQMRCLLQNARAVRLNTGGIPVCGVSNRHLLGRDDWRIGHSTPPAGPSPPQASCVERQHVGRRVANFKDSIQ